MVGIKYDKLGDGVFVDVPRGAINLPELTDVTSATATDKFALMADGSAYVGRAIVEADISDLSLSHTATFQKSIERSLNQLYLVAFEVPFDCVIQSIDHVTRSGSITATYYISSTAYTQGTAITGGSGSVTSTQATLTPTAANNVTAGQHVQVVFTSNSLTKGMEIAIEYTRDLV